MSIFDYFKKKLKQVLNGSITPETNDQNSINVTNSQNSTSQSVCPVCKERQGLTHEQDNLVNMLKLGGSIELDYKKLIEDPIKVLFEDVMGLTEIKEGHFDKMRYNSKFQGSVLVSSFYVAKMPVNLDFWKTLMNEEERHSYSTRVEWDEYLQLLKNLKELTKVDFSFPTSIQWEYATNTCESVKMPSYNNKIYLTYISVGLYDRAKRKWYDRPEYNLPYQVLSSIGNGHEALYLFLATNDNLSAINYTKEERKQISDFIRRIPYIHIINNPELG